MTKEKKAVTLAREHVQREELGNLSDMVAEHWYNETFGKRDVNVARENILKERKEMRRMFLAVDTQNGEEV